MGRRGSEDLSHPQNTQQWLLLDFARIAHYYLVCNTKVCVFLSYPFFPNSMAGPPISPFTSQVLASDKVCLVANIFLSDPMREEAEMLWSWVRARNTVLEVLVLGLVWGPCAEFPRLHFWSSFPFWQNGSLVSKGNCSHALKCLHC